jgi:hypothetical protein
VTTDQVTAGYFCEFLINWKRKEKMKKKESPDSEFLDIPTSNASKESVLNSRSWHTSTSVLFCEFVINPEPKPMCPLKITCKKV